MKLEVAILAGPESKNFLAELTKQLDRLERLNKAAFEDVQKVTKSETKPAAASFDDEAEVETPELETDDAVEATGDDFMDEPKSKKTAKAPKITVAEVNDACKARAKAGGKDGRAQVLKILKKNFKTESISELKPEQYAAAIKALEV